MTSDQHLQQLKDIKQMMESSSRFLSMSGISGILAGSFALLGTMAVWIKFNFKLQEAYYQSIFNIENPGYSNSEIIRFFTIDGLLVLFGALCFGFFFTNRNARKKGEKIFGRGARLMFINLAIPLIVGALFCFKFYIDDYFQYILPATLVFYGLALINGGKHTVGDIRYLGFAEIILGTVALFFPLYGLLLWGIGFGLLHILYGIVLYRKYE